MKFSINNQIKTKDLFEHPEVVEFKTFKYIKEDVKEGFDFDKYIVNDYFPLHPVWLPNGGSTIE